LREQSARNHGDPERDQIRDDLIDTEFRERDQQGARGDGNAQLRAHVQHEAPVGHEIAGDGGLNAAYHRERNDAPRQEEAEGSERAPLRLERQPGAGGDQPAEHDERRDATHPAMDTRHRAQQAPRRQQDARGQRPHR
jgi:hypothetical protein